MLKINLKNVSDEEVLKLFFDRKRENTVVMYNSIFKRLSGGGGVVSKVLGMDRVGVYNFMMELRGERSCSTVYKYMSMLSCFVDFLIFLGFRVENHFKVIKGRVGRDDDPVRPTGVFTDGEVREALEGEKDLKWRAVYALAFYTGMRRSEICGINFSDMAEDYSSVILRRTKVGGMRRQLIPEPARRYLREYVEVVRGYGGGAFFTGYGGKRLSCQGLYVRFKRHLGRSPHCARAYVITYLLRSGCGGKAVADFVGHRNLMQQYRYDKRGDESFRALDYFGRV